MSEVELFFCKIKEQPYVIYGAGYVAKRLLRSIKQKGMDKNLIGVVTSNPSCERFEGIEMYTLSDIVERDILIVIAVHESAVDEIERKIKKTGFRNYICVGPFFYDIILGSPFELKKIPLLEIVNSNRNLNMAYRYLVMDQYFGLCDDGYDIYIKCMSTFASKASAEKRLKSFLELIKNYETYGYDEKKMPSLLEDYSVIDGAHRIAVSSYFDVEELRCKLYRNPHSIDDVHDIGAHFNFEHMSELGLDDRTQIRILDIDKRIRLKYGKSTE